MLLRIVISVVAVAAVIWSLGFVRRAIATLRTGAPFTIAGQRGGAMPVAASFGRVGAVGITALVLAISYMIVRVAIDSWSSSLLD